jgi:FlaA1/EpsC-like NDP-sugar epimerase
VQAAALGETGQVYVLDMGEPVKIVDLARDMIRLSGHSLDEIRIEFSGLRPGEKLYEELLAATDTTLPTAIARLSIAKLDDAAAARAVLGWLLEGVGAHALEDTEVRAALQALLRGEFQPRL